MDIHRPKAAHNLREFLTEIGTIICGILIALGLEQGIEAIHWGEKVHAANEQINAELGGIYTYAKERVLIRPCQERRLSALRDSLLSSTGPWQPLASMHSPAAGDVVYAVSSRSWSDQAWRSFISDGTVPHMSARLRAIYNPLYAEADGQRDRNSRENELAAALNVLNQPLDLSTPERNALAQRIEEMRAKSNFLTVISTQIMHNIERSKRVDAGAAERAAIAKSNTYRSCDLLGLLDKGQPPSVPISPVDISDLTAHLVQDRD